MAGVVPDWVREQQRVEALPGYQANQGDQQTQQEYTGYQPYQATTNVTWGGPTGQKDPYLDPSSGLVKSPYEYFNQSNIQKEQDYNAAMQTALNKGDPQGYKQALEGYRSVTNGLQPTWSYNITPEGVASNAPHPNASWNQTFDRGQERPATPLPLPVVTPLPGGRGSGVDAGNRGPGGPVRPRPGDTAILPPAGSGTVGTGDNSTGRRPGAPPVDDGTGGGGRQPGGGRTGTGTRPGAITSEAAVAEDSGFRGDGGDAGNRGPGGPARPRPGDGIGIPTPTWNPGALGPPASPLPQQTLPYPIRPGTPGGGGGGGQRPGVTGGGGGIPGGGSTYFGGGFNGGGGTTPPPPHYGGGVPGDGSSTGGLAGTRPTAELPGPGTQYRPPAFDPNQGLDPLYYGYQIGAAGNPSLSYIPDLTTNDPNRLFRNAQNVGYNYGAGNAAQIGSDISEQDRLQRGYRAAADDAYGALSATPGFTDQETANIVREPGYRGAMTTDSEYADLGPTGAETAGMTGNVGSYEDYFAPGNFDSINQGNKNMQYANIDRVTGNENAAIGGLQHQYDLSIDPNRLRADAEYKRQAGMTDAEVERMANSGARNVSLSTQAQLEDMRRRMAASGQTSPEAIAAMTSRFMRNGAVGAADARVEAELAAREAQRRAATGVEQTRLGAEQNLTGYQTQAARDIANQQIGTAQYNAGLTKSAQDQIAANELNSQKYITDTGTSIRRAQDEAAAQRAAQQYGIRQQNTQYGQQSRYQQGMGVNNALSQNYATAAQARIGGQDKYRGYLTGQQTQALGAKQTATGQNLQNYNAMGGLMNSNAGQWANYQIGKSSLPSGWQQIIGGIASGVGAGTQPATF